MNNGQTIEKKKEAIINRTQGKTQDTYQRLLEGILQECNRVLKPGRHLVSTFNSKDFSVVASFIIAASRAGLRLLPDGVQYQAPIRPYMTTFHAMQIGAFVGDFVFVFEKDAVQPRLRPEDGELHNLKQTLAHLVDETAKAGRPEPRLREQAYAQLIPFLAKYAVADERDCRDAASFFESKIRQYDGYFKTTRKALIDKRKRDFGNKQRREPVTMLP
jgi:SAM-dependent methyltransferase